MTWSKAEIRQARKIPLEPLLRQNGVQLRELPGENYQIQAFGDLIVRDCYWIWKSRQLQGNTIDFFMIVENLTFAQAMQQILPGLPNPAKAGEGGGSPSPPNHASHLQIISNLPS
ncbi:MAG: hypothetical protein AABY46_07335 [Nitrospirota bacterium]